MNKKLIAALCCSALLVPVAGAEDYISKDAPFYEALTQAAEQSEQIAIGDYGPEAETDFETKRDAYLSGFESGVEYSYDSDVSDTPYSQSIKCYRFMKRQKKRRQPTALSHFLIRIPILSAR